MPKKPKGVRQLSVYIRSPAVDSGPLDYGPLVSMRSAAGSDGTYRTISLVIRNYGIYPVVGRNASVSHRQAPTCMVVLERNQVSGGASGEG